MRAWRDRGRRHWLRADLGHAGVFEGVFAKLFLDATDAPIPTCVKCTDDPQGRAVARHVLHPRHRSASAASLYEGSQLAGCIFENR
jgi:hypothetical protein